MAARRPPASKEPTNIGSIRHGDKRLNIPTVDGQDFVNPEVAAPVVERWDKEFRPDEPQLVWRGKADQPDTVDVTTPPIYIQEKVDPRALVEDLRRSAVKPNSEPATLFDDFANFDGLDEWQSVDYYNHPANWSNRMILGDSLAVMSSLASRENLRGQIQTIYIDPPYGIKFGSNWQPRADKRDVKDGNLTDIAREAEQIKAFRDTWEDGINSYLTYLRDRLLVARELLAESGSCFVQIGDENVHLVRSLMDEVFGVENFASLITFKTTSGAGSFSGGTNVLSAVNNFIVWYAKDLKRIKYRQLYQAKSYTTDNNYRYVEEADGTRRKLTADEQAGTVGVSGRVFRYGPTTSQTTRVGQTTVFPVTIPEGTFTPSKGGWKTNPTGMDKLKAANRLAGVGKTLVYIRYFDDFPVFPHTNLWDDTTTSGFGDPKIYVVQTNTKVIERCLLMTTDPGDLVLDPTCGSGTTAYVAEQWGRRWITIDTSRVAITLARQRLMAARFPYYLLIDSPEGAAKERSLSGVTRASADRYGSDVRQGFVYQRVPHVTLKSIANNSDIQEGMSRAEIDSAIKRHADTEFLHDRPYEDSKTIRVSGRFTVESLSPHRSVSFDLPAPGSREDSGSELQSSEASAGRSAPAYEETILENLEAAGIQNGRRQERLIFTAVNPFPGALIQALAVASTQPDIAVKGDESDEKLSQNVAVAIGPEYGTVDARFVKAAAREAMNISDVELLVVTGYAFEANAFEAVAEAQTETTRPFATVAGERQLGRLTVLLVRMNIDLAMGDELLKKTASANLFTIFGEPDIDVSVTSDGVVVSILGVDVYDPTTGAVRSGGTEGIALWMIDTSYDDEQFFVRHAYFSGQGDPYKRLRASLRAQIDEAAWKSLYSTESRPFPLPESGKIAVKAINYYGDEVLVVREVR
jgi:adenine-specific DNA-methyltransferase